MEWIRPNLSSFILLLNAQYLHEKIEINVEKRVENLSKLLENPRKEMINSLKDDLISSQVRLFYLMCLVVKFFQTRLTPVIKKNLSKILSELIR